MNTSRILKINLSITSVCAVLTVLISMIIIGDYPPYSFHTHREADTTNLILNYNQDQAELLKPRVHQRGNGLGIVGSEFPFIYFMMSKLISIEGHYYFLLRIIQLFFYSLATLSFLGIVFLITQNKLLALFSSTLFVLNPLMLYYGFKIMPEIHYVSLGLAGAYFGLYGISKGTLRFLLIGMGLIGVSASIKPFGIIFLAPIFLFGAHITSNSLVSFFRKHWHQLILALIPILMMLGWFYYANSLGSDTFAIQYSLSKQITTWLTPEFYNVLFIKTGMELYTSFGGFIILVLGVWILIRKKVTGILNNNISILFKISLLWGALAFLLVFIFGAHHILHSHDYYGIILVPPLTLLITLVLHECHRGSSVYKYMSIALTVMFCIGCVLRYQIRIIPKPYDYVKLQREIRSVIPLEKRVLVRDETSPVITLNAINRYGEAISTHEPNEVVIQKMTRNGYWYVCVFEKTSCHQLLSQYSNQLIPVGTGSQFQVLRMR